jgi:hypothetical protein
MGFRDPLVGGTRLIRTAIQSPNFVTGVSGWIVRRDGSAEFLDVIIRGELWVGIAPNPQIHLHTDPGTNGGHFDVWTNHATETWPGGVNGEVSNIDGTDALALWVFSPTDVGGDQGWLVLYKYPGGATGMRCAADDFVMLLDNGADFRSNAGARAAQFRQQTDAAHRFEVIGTGVLGWGDGTNPSDVNLYRAAANVLATDDSLRSRGLYPRMRAATSVNTTTTATFTAETITDSVTFSAIQGKTYAIEFRGGWRSSVANDIVGGRIREDNIAGTTLQQSRVLITAATSTNLDCMYGQYTHAAASGNKTIVVTGFRSAGAGNISRVGAATIPSYLFVDLID